MVDDVWGDYASRGGICPAFGWGAIVDDRFLPRDHRRSGRGFLEEEWGFGLNGRKISSVVSSSQ